MLRKLLLFLALAMALTVIPTGSGTLEAQADGPHAVTGVETNLRTGPGTSYDVITMLPSNTAVTIEARTQDLGWMLIKTQDGSVRGWGKVSLFKFSAGVKLASFPVSSEIVSGNQPGAGGSGGGGEAPPPLPKVSGTAAIGLPLVPTITPAIRAAMRSVVAKGKALGNNLRAFSKVGDCQTEHWAFFRVFGWGKYDLGKYGYLQAVIDWFNVPPREGVGGSFDLQSLASNNGFNSSAVQETAFANPAVCQANEGSLECEYRLNKPAVSFIMFGTADVLVMTPSQFNQFMRQVVKKTMDRGIVPILSTFPENPTVAEKSRIFNQLVVTLAREKSIPIMNLADALKPLPNWGLESDLIHLTIPPGETSGIFNNEYLQFGYTVRNLIALQTLDVVWRQILR